MSETTDQFELEPLSELSSVVDERAEAYVDPPAPPSSLTVADYTPCVECGYNLWAWLLDGECPECGAPVERSIRANLLIYADPRWLRRVSRGIALTILAFLAPWVLLLISLVPSQPGSGAAETLIKLAAMLGLLCAGVLQMTAPEPRQAGHEPWLSLRRLTRVAAILFALSIIFQYLVLLAERRGTVVPAWQRGIAAISLLSIVPLYCFGFLYLKQLAGRIPDHRLARSTGRVMWGLIACAAGIVLVLVADRYFDGRLYATARVLCIVLGAMGIVVFAIWSLFLVYMYHQSFRHIRRLSKWAVR